MNQAIQAMILDEGQILPEYACFYLEFYRPWLIERANAVTVPNLTKEQLSGIPVVFPCLEEQQVIVDQLKRARRLMQRLSLIHISEPTRRSRQSRMPSSA